MTTLSLPEQALFCAIADQFLDEFVHKFDPTTIFDTNGNLTISDVHQRIKDHRDFRLASYVLVELASWHCGRGTRQYGAHLSFVEWHGDVDADFRIVKLGYEYYKMYSDMGDEVGYCIEKVEPKFKEVLYFE